MRRAVLTDRTRWQLIIGGRSDNLGDKTEVALEVALPMEGVIVRFIGEADAVDLTPAEAAAAAAGSWAWAAYAETVDPWTAAASRSVIVKRAERIAAQNKQPAECQ